jgi:hypothetical protein
VIDLSRGQEVRCEGIGKTIQRPLGTLRLDADSVHLILHEAGQTVKRRETINVRTEPDALDCPLHQNRTALWNATRRGHRPSRGVNITRMSYGDSVGGHEQRSTV